ncbi:hypothetical protein PoB_006368500 [Plakobranchus ocellatus]|uniref:Uncharacterized protein n=1 Tax=Plakobranchus ocellatus TaxID=259542 RepID=A0AAV4CZ72_9GAST|nr:hypothetical protein PoB_006368500 [Plakobranchus ocellatus]
MRCDRAPAVFSFHSEIYSVTDLSPLLTISTAHSRAHSEVVRFIEQSKGANKEKLINFHPSFVSSVPSILPALASHLELEHSRVIDNEIADRLENEGRTQPQPRKPSTLSDVRLVLRRGAAELSNAAHLSNDERLPKFCEAFKAYDYLQGLHRSDAVQIFPCKSEAHVPPVGPSATRLFCPTVCRLVNEMRRFRMFCPHAGNWTMFAPRDGLLCPLTISFGGRTG